MRLDARQNRRYPLRTPARLAFGAGKLEVTIEDFAAGGCGLVSPMALRRGQAVFLSLALPALPGKPELSTHATVVWTSAGAPHRSGLAFGRDDSADRERGLRSILEALAGPGRVLPELRPDTWLHTSAAADLEPLAGGEREVLVAAMEGGTALDLLERTGGPAGRRALLFLMARGMVTQGVGPERSRRRLEADRDELLFDFPTPPPRPARAAVSLEMAREERAAGHVVAALEWLHAAAAEAPDDPEICAELDALALLLAC